MIKTLTSRAGTFARNRVERELCTGTSNSVCPGLGGGELSPVGKANQSCVQVATPYQLLTISSMQHLSCKTLVLKSTGVLTKGNKTAYLLSQDTFEEMPESFKEKLSSSVAAHLNRVLRKIDMDLFLPLLLEMILLKVKHAEENIADVR